MSNSQKRAVRNYRRRLGEQGLARFEVLGLDTDRELIRTIARRLAEPGSDADALREEIRRILTPSAPRVGGVLAALRRSPLQTLDLRREHSSGRDLDL